MVSSECRTWVRWAVSNSTTASGKQNSLEHFSWPPLPNHPRLQLMWFWKMLLFYSPKHLEKKAWNWRGDLGFFFPGDSSLKTYICSLLLLYLQKGGGRNLNLLNYYNCILRKSNSENYFYTHIKPIYSLKGPDQWASTVAQSNIDHSSFNLPLVRIFVFFWTT